MIKKISKWSSILFYKDTRNSLQNIWSSSWSNELRSNEISDSKFGYRVSNKFRIINEKNSFSRNTRKELNYDDYIGLRFPSLDTGENFRYWKDIGLNKIIKRVFPLKVPKSRTLNPWLREYIYFLHMADSSRFSILNISQRYNLNVNTIKEVISAMGTNLFLKNQRLTTLNKKRISAKNHVMELKEHLYSNKIGWDEIGDENPDIKQSKINPSINYNSSFRGWKSTFDWVRRQQIEIEMFRAYPMPGKRDPFPKRVDIDATVDNTNNYKIIHWIDPTDKVIF